MARFKYSRKLLRLGGSARATGRRLQPDQDLAEEDGGQVASGARVTGSRSKAFPDDLR